MRGFSASPKMPSMSAPSAKILIFSAELLTEKAYVS
jgi:hypothetical protein